MAVNCSVRPLATDGFTGATAIDTSAAGLTVRVKLWVASLPTPLWAVMVSVRSRHA